MKTTIKITKNTAMTVTPCRTGGLTLDIEHRNGEVATYETFSLTPDQAGALIFGIEIALDQIEIAKARKAVTA